MGEAVRVLPLPPATGVRPEWTQTPDRVRAAVEGHLGSPVVSAVNQRGGFSPGLAARVRCRDGTRAFVKAVGTALNPRSPGMHRSEGEVAAGLPADVPAPRLRFRYDDGDWVALVFDEIDGRPPRTPWQADELRLVLAALTDLAAALTPCPLAAAPTLQERMGDGLTAYRRLAAEPAAQLTRWERAHLPELVELGDRAPDLLAGDTLLHLDVRGDNVLLGDGGRVWFVDWPWAARGAAWVDAAILVMNAAVHGFDPESIVDDHPLLSGAGSLALTALLAGLAATLADAWWRPAPPGLPTVREFQRAHHRAVLAWLQRRWPG
jgi:hypothetical protein